MRKAHIVALVAQLWAFILAFIILFAGKNKQITDIYIIKINATNLGRDALRDTTLFTLNNSNIIYSIVSTYDKNGTIPVAVPVATTTPTPKKGKAAPARQDMNTRQAPPPTTPAPATPDTAILLASGVIDTVVSWIGADPYGKIPMVMKKAATVSITDIEDGFAVFKQTTSNKVLGDVSTVMANYLQDLAASYKNAAGAPSAAKSAKLAAVVNERVAGVRQLSSYTDFQMSSEDADAVMEALLREIDNPALAENLAKEMPQVISNLNGSTPNTGIFTSQKGIKAVDEVSFPNPLAPLQGALMTAGPTILAGAKSSMVKSMNGGLESFKQTVPIFDWYKFYPVHMCWGFYKTDKKSGKIHDQIVGCGTTAKWKDINLSPIVQKMLNKNGVKAQAPPQIGMGNGLETTFEGLRKFTGLIYGINVLTIVNLTFALLTTLAGIGLTGFLELKQLKTVYFIALNLCAGSLSLVYGNAIVMLMSLGGVAFMMPGTGESLGAIVSIGGGFLAMLWLNTAMCIIGTGAWMMMWLSLVREEEFEKGKAAGTATVTMVNGTGNGYDMPKNG